MINAKTILFSSLIVAMILPFHAMDFAQADTEKIGRDIVKEKNSYEKIPEDAEERKAWLDERHKSDVENKVRIQQDMLLNALTSKYQSTDKSGENYFPWSSIGYDYEDNALQVTVDTSEFSDENIRDYQKTIRSIVGNSIDVSISPMEKAEFAACYSRTNCPDLESGVEIGMDNKDFPCTLGFAATYDGRAGFVTAGHCFDGTDGGGTPTGNDAYHPENGNKIGDLVIELATAEPFTYTFCDCAFVEAGGVSGNTFGMTDASSVGSIFMGKAVKQSLSQSEIQQGTIVDPYVHMNTFGGYYLIGVVMSSANASSGDSGGAVFSDDGSELLGIVVARSQGGSLFVKHDKVTQYFDGLTWNF